MNRRAVLGLFTILSLGALFGVFYVLSDFGTKAAGYRIGIHFFSTGGMHTGALVYESGVVIGSVDAIRLLPDYSTEVVLAIKAGVEVPSEARFLILQPLTGDPTLRILPGLRAAQSSPLPHEVLPISQQPVGRATLSLAEFLVQGEDQFQKIDSLLVSLQTRGPKLMDDLDRTLISTNQLTMTANKALDHLGTDADATLRALSGSAQTLTVQLSDSLEIASNQIIDLTKRMNDESRRGQPHVDHMLAELDATAVTLKSSVDALHSIAADPNLKQNALQMSRSLAATTETFAALLADFRQVTGNSQTQQQLRDTIANFDASSQRLSSLLARFGGRSRVQGVDVPLEEGPASAVPGSTDGNASSPSPTVPAQGTTSGTQLLKQSFSANPSAQMPALIGFDVRAGELSPVRSQNGTALTSPLLTNDRGPQTDVTLIGLPNGPTNILLGANDIGATSTLTLAAQEHRGALRYGGGVLYSRLGVMGSLSNKLVGVETRIYDPRRGSIDVYGNVFASHGIELYAGERDLARMTRRSVYGIDIHFP